MTPTLAILKDGLPNSVTICNNGEELERLFAATCSSYGVEAVDDNLDDGYMELECGTTICMCWADKVNNIDTYIKSLEEDEEDDKEEQQRRDEKNGLYPDKVDVAN